MKPRLMVLGCMAALLLQGHAQAQTQPNLEGYRNDPEVRCVAQWHAVIPALFAQPGTEGRTALKLSGQLEPFMDEIQNKAVDLYSVKEADGAPVVMNMIAEATEALWRDRTQAIQNIKRDCQPFLDARQAARAPTSAVRCANLIQSRRNFLAGFSAPASKDGKGKSVPMVGVLNDFEARVWRNWAERSLIAEGLDPKSARQKLDMDGKALRTEQAQARKAGKTLVFDRHACQTQHDAFSTAHQTPKPARKPDGATEMIHSL